MEWCVEILLRCDIFFKWVCTNNCIHTTTVKQHLMPKNKKTKKKNKVGDKIFKWKKHLLLAYEKEPTDHAVSGRRQREGGMERDRELRKSLRVWMWFRDGVHCLHGLPGGMRFCLQENIVSMGGTSLRPHFPLCVSLSLFSPAAQGHAMVWERLMHLQRHAVKSN